MITSSHSRKVSGTTSGRGLRRLRPCRNLTSLISPMPAREQSFPAPPKIHPALDTLPVYVRGGSILPMQPLIQSTDETPNGPLELRVYPGQPCAGSLYLDDGHTLGYQHGEFLRQTFTLSVRWQLRAGQLRRTPGNVFTMVENHRGRGLRLAFRLKPMPGCRMGVPRPRRPTTHQPTLSTS